MRSPLSLLFDETSEGQMLINKDPNSLFTKGVAAMITNYYGDTKDIRERKIQLLGKVYENNYQIFVR